MTLQGRCACMANIHTYVYVHVYTGNYIQSTHILPFEQCFFSFHVPAYKHCFRSELVSRQHMDRRRLEEAFMQYALLRVCSWYPSVIKIDILFLHEGLTQTLRDMIPLFLRSFSQRNAGLYSCRCTVISTHYVHMQVHVCFTLIEHRCDVVGCGKVIVLDGNMKNNREVCYAIDAGYMEFDNLPGRIKTGCPNTPAFKSRYCPIHAPFMTIPQNVQFSPAEDSMPTSSTSTQIGAERAAAIIVNKRVTRSSTFYQVVYTYMHAQCMSICAWISALYAHVL